MRGPAIFPAFGIAFLVLVWTPLDARTQQGACCFLTGQCIETTAINCLFGAFHAGLTRCDFTGPCTIGGACCLSDGSCSIGCRDDCAALGGLFQGIGVTCSLFPCLGEYCITGGSCARSSGGSFQEPGTTCAPNSSPPAAAFGFGDGNANGRDVTDFVSALMIPSRKGG